jgi:PAS domain S-box-containing protein
MLPVLWLILWANFEDRETRANLARTQAMNMVQLVAHTQDQLIESTRHILVTLAQTPQVQKIDPIHCSAFLADLNKQHPFFANMGVAGPDGRALCSALPMARPVSYADREWFSRIMQTRQFTVGDYIIGRISKKPIISLSYPVFNEKSLLTGVAYVGMDLDWLNHLLVETGLPLGSTLTVIDRKGTILCRHPDPEKWVGRNMSEAPLVKDILDRKAAGTIENTGLDGVRRLYAFAPLSDKPEVGAFVFAGIPSSAAFAEADRILYRNMMILGIMVILSLVAVWWFSRFFVLQPVDRLLNVTRRLAQGELTARAGPPYIGGEIGQLAISFDQMVESLQQKEEDRKRAEEAVRQSEEKYRDLFDKAMEGVYQTTPEGRLISANMALARMFGYESPEEMINAITDLASQMYANPDDRKIAVGMFKEKGYIKDFECQMRRKDGSIFWARYDGQFTKTADGTPCFQGFIIDINDRKHAEESLYRHIQRLKNIHKMDMAILLAIETPEEIAQSALIYLRKLLCYEHGSISIIDMGKKESLIYLAEAESKKIVKIEKVLPEIVIRDAEILQQSKVEVIEDMSKVISLSAVAQMLEVERVNSSIIATATSPKGLISALHVGWEIPRTISQEEAEIASEVAAQIAIANEQARMMQEIKGYTAKLEQRVLERTTQLEAANKELEAFSYSVSHDLRAPLRSVDAFARMIEEDYAERLDGEGRRLLQVIRDSAHDMGQLISDLLDFSRLSRKDLKMGRIGMSELATDVRQQVEQAETGRAIRWDLGELPPAFGDEAMICVVLINLLANAAKYTRPRQEAAIGISGRVEGDEVIYSVTDNGVGFDMAYKDKLFGVFQRLHTTAEFEGTGIGLALVQRIVQRHGGRVWAEGKVNEGATFYFTLPCRKNEEDEMRKVEKEETT